MLSHWVVSDSLPRIVARQAPLSLGFSRQEYWSGLPCPPPGDLPKPGIEPRPPTLQADSLPSETPGKPSGVMVSHSWVSPMGVRILSARHFVLGSLWFQMHDLFQGRAGTRLGFWNPSLGLFLLNDPLSPFPCELADMGNPDKDVS